jgi:hypothetical protein
MCRLAGTRGGQLASKQLLLEVLDAMTQQQLLAEQRDSSSTSSRPAVEQQLLQSIVQTLLLNLVRRSPDFSVLGVEDLAELLCIPLQLSAQERRSMLRTALLSAAYIGEGAESSRLRCGAAQPVGVLACCAEGFSSQDVTSCLLHCCRGRSPAVGLMRVPSS